MASPAPLPYGGGASLFKPILHGGEDGMSMVPLEYLQVVILAAVCYLLQLLCTASSHMSVLYSPVWLLLVLD